MIAPARKGAHPERWLRARRSAWSRAGRARPVCYGHPRPELPGALEVDRAARRPRRRRLARPHRGRPPTEVAAAVAAGATAVTHLGNAMPPLPAREPGPVGAALGGPTWWPG